MKSGMKGRKNAREQIVECVINLSLCLLCLYLPIFWKNEILNIMGGEEYIY